MPTELTNLGNLLNTLLNYLVYLGGPICALFIGVGGIQYATAGGSPRQAEKGMSTMQYALLGLGIIIFAKLITTIVGKALKSDFALPGAALPTGLLF